MGADLLANALEVKLLGLHVDALAVTRKHVGERDRHVEDLDSHLQILAGLRVAVVENRLGQLAPGPRVKSQQAQASIQEHGPPGHAVDDTVLHQHAAVDRPDGFHLLERRQPPVLRRGAEAPDKLPVCGAEAIDPAIRGPEQAPALIDRRRRIDASAYRVAPQDLAGVRVEGVHRVGVHGGDEDLAPGDNHAAEFPAQLPLPLVCQLGWHGRLREAAAGRIVAIRGPLVLPCRGWGPGVSVRGAPLKPLLVQPLLRRLPGCGLRAQGAEAVQLRLGIAGAGMRRRVDQPVAGHDAVDAPASDPVMALPVLRRHVYELDARSRGQQVTVGRLGAIASVMEPVGLNIGLELALHLSGVDVPAGEQP